MRRLLGGTFTSRCYSGCGTAVVAGDKVAFWGLRFAFGFALIAMALALGPISGCHINPAVSLVFFAAGRIKLEELIGYIIAQCAGAIVAAYVLYVLCRAKFRAMISQGLARTAGAPGIWANIR